MEERNASYLLNSFVIQKINDEIAFAAETPKLLEIGLVYGDLIAFRQRFPAPLENNNNITNYHERAKELKQKVLKKHSGRKDILERPICINRSYAVTFGFKYHERGRYRHKLNQNFVKTFSRDATYEELHDAARLVLGKEGVSNELGEPIECRYLIGTLVALEGREFIVSLVASIDPFDSFVSINNPFETEGA